MRRVSQTKQKFTWFKNAKICRKNRPKLSRALVLMKMTDHSKLNSIKYNCYEQINEILSIINHYFIPSTNHEFGSIILSNTNKRIFLKQFKKEKTNWFKFLIVDFVYD